VRSYAGSALVGRPGSDKSDVIRHTLPDDVSDGDDAVRTRGAVVVYDGCVALHPQPAAMLHQEPVIARRHLALLQHYRTAHTHTTWLPLK